MKPVDGDFVHLLASWFNRSFLVLRRIDWTTPAHILEKIIRYEAVHEIKNWDDLRNRLASPDRRCYGFFHPQLSDEPLIFVEVALTEEIPEAIAPLLKLDRTPIRAADATTAVFYSISNTQRGLGGISFGNFLIKQVVEELKRELPNLETFVTLSPVPDFARWLNSERASEKSQVLTPAMKDTLAALDRPGWYDDEENARVGPRCTDPAGGALFPQSPRRPRATARFCGALPPRQRRAAGAAEFSRRRLRERPAAGVRADGELPLRSRRDREQPRGVRREGHRGGGTGGEEAVEGKAAGVAAG